MVMALIAWSVVVPVEINDCCSLEVFFRKPMMGFMGVELCFENGLFRILVLLMLRADN
jgi:hypothetical protein